MRHHLSIGDICTSRIWISLERRHQPVLTPFFHVGPTYVGALTGVSIGYRRLVLLAHIRS